MDTVSTESRDVYGGLIKGTDKWVPVAALANECKTVESETGTSHILAGVSFRGVPYPLRRSLDGEFYE